MEYSADYSIDAVTVTRVGTQVVVRLAGDVDDARGDRLEAALVEITTIVLSRVVVDCSSVTSISGAGMRFLRAAQSRWQLRLLDPPPGVRQSLAHLPMTASNPS